MAEQVKVSFQHWRHQVASTDLTKYGSPHFSQETAGRALTKAVFFGADLADRHDDVEFDPAHILCANEAFPESAIADPLADLEVWDQWRSGNRAFPYPGRFSRLGIRRQERKVSSTSSLGVLGEVMAGVYAQAGIAPNVLVRCVRRWPDFIFHTGGGHYAFVEAKAFASALDPSGGLPGRIQPSVLAECMVDAVHQLNADPVITVWFAFTYVVSVRPVRLKVTFLEVDADPAHHRSVTARVLPTPVLEHIAECAVELAVEELDRARPVLRGCEEGPWDEEDADSLRAKIVALADKHIEGLVIDIGLEQAVTQSRKAVEDQIRHQARKVAKGLTSSNGDSGTGREQSGGFWATSAAGAGGQLERIRSAATRDVVRRYLSPEEQTRVTNEWTRDWGSAPKPFSSTDGVALWRCGGALFGLI